MKKLVLIELNEINFDIVKKYLTKENFPILNEISNNLSVTKSEDEYSLLEPWIQWFTIHTGLSAKEHKIFRLGDGAKSLCTQFFEIIENFGYSVGAISPMNARNNLKKEAYFIPDPWTYTDSDNSTLSKKINQYLKETVNSNAKQKIGFKNYLFTFFLLIKFGRLKNVRTYFEYFFKSFKKKWFKALFLDCLLNDIHLYFFKKKKPNFSTIFFNSGAHIQHHYFFNSLACDTNNLLKEKSSLNKKNDPFKDCLKFYDMILGEYVQSGEFELIIATGLTQVLNEKAEYYYRLKSHDNFLKKLDIKFKSLYPRMSRDFLIEFDNNLDRDKCFETLHSINLNQTKLFGIIEKKDKSLFVSLTYDKEIKKNDFFNFNEKIIKMFNQVAFVAIKNGKHNQKGFLYLSKNILKKNLYLNQRNKTINIKLINNIVVDFFKN